MKRSGFINHGNMCEFYQDFKSLPYIFYPIPNQQHFISNSATAQPLEYDKIMYQNEKTMSLDFITTGDIWKTTCEPVSSIGTCKVCRTVFFLSCVCKWETNGFWVTGYNEDKECTHIVEFTCFHCSK